MGSGRQGLGGFSIQRSVFFLHFYSIFSCPHKGQSLFFLPLSHDFFKTTFSLTPTASGEGCWIIWMAWTGDRYARSTGWNFFRTIVEPHGVE